MGSRGKVRYVFTSSHTSTGFYTFIPDLLQGIQKIYILKGSVGTGKSTFIRLLGESLAMQGYVVEFWISALDPVNPEGLYIPQLDAAVVNGSLSEVGNPQYLGEPVEIIDLGAYQDKQAMDFRQEEIRLLALRVEKQNDKAYNILKSASNLIDEIKQFNSRHLNMNKIQQVMNQIREEILTVPIREKHYFASALTVDGVIDYVDELSVDCLKRYVFKGPVGSGKSAIINEMACQARDQGHSLEFYHWGLVWEDVTMLIIRDLQIALINAGNMEIIKKPWDMVIDMSSCLDASDSDVQHEKDSEVFRDYESRIRQAQKLLEAAQDSRQDLKKIHARNMNFELLNQKREEIRKELCERS
ncbi:MAG: hypothetical protein PHX14_01455 [Syntrophomonadaceae bacterium]|nr:hypothetical protein [Syntrophomonadaceae bacterium]